MDSGEMREKRAELAAEIRNLADAAEGRDFTADEQTKWDDLNARYDAETKQIEVRERAEEIQREQDAVLGRPATTPEGRTISGEEMEERRDQAFRGWALAQLGEDIPSEYEEAARESGLNLNANNLHIPLFRTAPKTAEEVRDMNVGTDADGGYTVPTTLVAAVENAMLAFGGMRRFATILRTSSGEPLHIPTCNDTGNAGALLAESTQVTEQDATMSEVILNSYKYTSKLVRVSSELLRDSAINFPAWLGALLGERIGRILNTQFTTGTGTAQPNGAVTASALGVTAAGVAAITSDEVIDLFHSVDPAYRAMPGAAFMANDSTVKLIRKLKDSDGQYIWQPGLQAGQPETILSKPLVVNQDVPAATTGLKSMLFGDFGKYYIRDVAGMRLRRLVERYADFDQDGFVAFSSHDGDEIDAGTNPIKHLIQA